MSHSIEWPRLPEPRRRHRLGHDRAHPDPEVEDAPLLLLLDALLLALIVVVLGGVVLGKLVPLTGRQTIVIGGLVRDNITISERKVPLLGDIPFLGWLFKFQSRQVEKLNLLVFLTPTLVRDEVDMVELNARKSAELGTLQRENRIEEPTKLKQDDLEKLERQNGTPRPLPNTVDPSAPLQPPVQPE